jgi:hypothetical protein
MAEVNRKWLFRELRHSLSLLALDVVTTIAAVPNRCCNPDELALDFDNFRAAVVSNFSAEMPAELVAVLARVDAAFRRIHGGAWSEESVRTAPEWATVRGRARVALELLVQFES